MKLNQKKSDKLFIKAQELIPGGIFGHYKYAVREEGPKFFSKAKDAYFWDVDGNKYLDLICGWGPMILGYNNPKIDQAARSQYDLGNTVSVASPIMIELAETGMTMLVVTHEMGFARTVANRVIFMDDGQIIEQNEPEEFFNNPQSDRTKLFLSQILQH